MTIKVMEIIEMQGETDQIVIKLVNASLQEDLKAGLSEAYRGQNMKVEPLEGAVEETLSSIPSRIALINLDYYGLLSLCDCNDNNVYGVEQNS